MVLQLGKGSIRLLVVVCHELVTAYLRKQPPKIAQSVAAAGHVEVLCMQTAHQRTVLCFLVAVVDTTLQDTSHRVVFPCHTLEHTLGHGGEAVESQSLQQHFRQAFFQLITYRIIERGTLAVHVELPREELVSPRLVITDGASDGGTAGTRCVTVILEVFVVVVFIIHLQHVGIGHLLRVLQVELYGDVLPLSPHAYVVGWFIVVSTSVQSFFVLLSFRLVEAGPGHHIVVHTAQTRLEGGA